MSIDPIRAAAQHLIDMGYTCKYLGHNSGRSFTIEHVNGDSGEFVVWDADAGAALITSSVKPIRKVSPPIKIATSASIIILIRDNCAVTVKSRYTHPRAICWADDPAFLDWIEYHVIACDNSGDIVDEY